MSYAYRMAKDTDEAAALQLWAFGCTGLEEEKDALVAYFPERLELPVAGVWEELGGRDWVAEYYAALEAVRLDTLVIAPTHRELSLEAGQKPLWLDPGMAFGTGHHETTFLALASLEALDVQGKRVLDVGAGSGILAIAADILGAAEVVGLDIDADTLPIAEANAALNRSRARFVLGSLEAVAAPYDIIVANLFAELHVELIGAYLARLKPGGVLLLTGISQARREIVEAALRRYFKTLERRDKGGWLLFKAQEPKES